MKLRSLIRLRLRGRAWLGVAAALTLVGVALVAVGMVGLLRGGGSAETEPFNPSLIAPPNSTPVGTPSVRVRTPTPTPTPIATATPVTTPEPTPAPSDAPIARLIIETAGTDAEVQVKGIDDNNVMEVPDTPYLVAWYDFTGYPGYGANSVFSAHVDYYPNIKGAFWGVKNVEEGDIVRVMLSDGTEYRYRVIAKAMYSVDNIPMGDILDQDVSSEVVTLITCGGRFIPNEKLGYGGYYADRLVVRAELITETDGTLSTASFGPEY